MVPGERDYPINAKVSSEAARRLKQIATKRNMSYGEILDGLIMGVPLPTADWEEPLTDVLSRIELLEAQVSALLSGSMPIANTETLPAVVSIAPSALGGDLSASDATRIDEPGPTEITAETAVESEIEALPEDHQKPSLPTPSNPSPTRTKSVKEAIADLVNSGMRSQTDIARALNAAGYRTQTKTEFIRSNPQIKAALVAVKEADHAAQE